MSRLREERAARVRKPFQARGSSVERCPRCRVPAAFCVCAQRPAVRETPRAGFCLLLHDIEPLRPSNTGWLVADTVKDTHAFGWARTTADPALLALLADPSRRPFVVFPADAAPAERVVRDVAPADGRRPLFVLLDATWPEARKMFRKSPYLDRFPVLSFDVTGPARYLLRRTRAGASLCTAEVAAACLRVAGETSAATDLDAWLDTFVEASMRLRPRPSGPATSRSPL